MYTRTLAQWEVSAIGLGGLPLSIDTSRPSEEEAIRAIHAAIDTGITLMDTADSYCLDDSEMGHNERLFGKALSQLPASKRQKIVVITKCGQLRPQGGWERDGSPTHIREATHASLRNLRVDAIPVQQYHRIDPKTPLEDTYGELMKLQEEGKIVHIGASNHSVAELTDALGTGAKVVSLQNEFSLKHRDPEFDGTLAFTRERNIAFLCWSPLDGMGEAQDLGIRHPAIAEMAAARELSPQRMALAWLLSIGPHVIPIPGSARIAHIQDCAAATTVVLTRDELVLLEAEKSQKAAAE